MAHQPSRMGVWIEAFRLRTLPLALSVTLMGSLLAIADGTYHTIVIILSLVTTLFLQILSNLANDYGDALKGTDNEKRVGPQRTVQSGQILPGEMKSAIIIFALLSFLSGLGLLYAALGNHFLTAFLFLLLGVGAIAAAIKYTTGDHAYGYKGWGDFFVFLFFGWVAVMGTYYLNTLQFRWALLLPASAMGFFSTGVLNLNNMRDTKNDKAAGKHTLASRMGYRKARYYHLSLLVLGWIFSLIYAVWQYRTPWNFLFLLVFPLFLRDAVKIMKTADETLLDPFLKRLALSTLLFSLLYGIGMCL